MKNKVEIKGIKVLSLDSRLDYAGLSGVVIAHLVFGLEVLFWGLDPIYI